jgi:hypothetical protein
MAVGLQIKVGADVTGLMGAFQAAAGGAGSLTDSLKATVASMSPMGAAGVAVADALVGMTNAAAEDRAEQEKLNAIYVSAGAATDGYTEAIGAAIDAGAEKAFSDSEVRAGLQSLVVATGDAAKANELLGPAMDIARLAGVDLETASKALAKAHDGNDAALRKLIPGLEKGATAADTIAAATELASGQADLYATSSEGMGKKSSDAFSEISEQIGAVFLPIMDEVLPALMPIVEILGELITAVLPLLKPAISIVVGAIKIFIQVLQTLIGIIKQVMGFIGDLVQKAQDAVNFVGSIDLNPFDASRAAEGGGAYPAESARSSRSRSSRAGAGPGAGNVTVNVYGGDPHAITRAVARGYRGWTGISGRTAGTREF